MSARWLDDVLARHGLVLSSEQIDALAADIRGALPVDGQAIARSIRESAACVLRQRSIEYGGNGVAAVVDVAEVAREIGNNASAVVVLELQVPEAA